MFNFALCSATICFVRRSESDIVQSVSNFQDHKKGRKIIYFHFSYSKIKREEKRFSNYHFMFVSPCWLFLEIQNSKERKKDFYILYFGRFLSFFPSLFPSISFFPSFLPCPIFPSLVRRIMRFSFLD